MNALCLQAGSKSGSEQIPDIYYIPETSWHGIDCAGWLSYFRRNTPMKALLIEFYIQEVHT